MELELKKLKDCWEKFRKGSSDVECESLIEKYQNLIGQLPSIAKIQIMNSLDLRSIVNMCDSSEMIYTWCDKDLEFKTYICERINQDLDECSHRQQQNVYRALKKELNRPSIKKGNVEEWRDAQGRLHREADLPAFVNPSAGLQKWYKHGKIHRNGDNPAVESKERLMWYKNGNLHRDDDKPAIITPSVKTWFNNGKLYKLQKGKKIYIFTPTSDIGLQLQMTSRPQDYAIDINTF